MSKQPNPDVFAAKQAQSYMGEFAWPTIILAAVLSVGFVFTFGGMITGALPLWAGYISASLITYGIYTVLHDAVHGCVHGKVKSMAWLNDLLGYIAGQIMLLSFKAHQREHLAHHRYTNRPDEDPDLYVKTDNLWGVFLGSFFALPLQYKYYFDHCWAKAKISERFIVIAELFLMVGWRAALVWFGYWEIALLSLAALQTGAFILVVFFAWLVHRPYDKTARYENTATYVFPGPLDTIVSWLWLFQNYHSIHHLFPKVPFYRYRDVFRNIEDVMISKDAPIIRVLGAGKRQAVENSLAR